MFTKITVIILVIALVMQSYCIRVLMDMMDEIQEGYKLIDGRISEINDRSYSNSIQIKRNADSINVILRRLGL